MAVIVTLLIIGTILLLLESVLPGMIAGILGFGCLIAAVVMGYNISTTTGNVLLAVVSVGLLAGTLLWFQYFPKSRIGKVFVSKSVVGDVNAQRPDLLECEGTAHTDLRPSGTVEIDGERVDVVTEGSLIKAGTPVKVVAIEGMRVVVRAVDPVLKSSESNNS